MAKLKMGVISGKPLFTTMGKFKASEVLSARSGRYVTFDASADYYVVTPSNNGEVSGYVEQNLTCIATDKATELPIATNIGDFVCELPYASGEATDSTLTQANLDTYLGDHIDIYTSTIQYADISTSQGIFVVVGGSVANNSLYVRVVDGDIDQQA